MSYKLIIADNQAVYRTGTARVIVIEDDFRIVGQCDDLQRLYKATESAVGTIILFAASLEPDAAKLVQLSKAGGNRLVGVLENTESRQPYQEQGLQGILYRDVAHVEMMNCLRSVARGSYYYQDRSAKSSARFESDMVGERVRERLTPKELRIVALIVQGYKNRDIARELSNTEQVIKNYLRSIFDKTGVSDRLELALFTIHHRILSQIPKGSQLDIEDIVPAPGL